MTKIRITEESDQATIAEWYERAKLVKSPAELATFIGDLSERYEHDYGTIVHAATAASLAAFWTLNAGPQGGLTGFQASFVALHFPEKLMQIDGPHRRVEFKEMLYPQSERMFRMISRDMFAWLQEQARARLKAGGAHPEVVAHWQSIVDGVVPFGYELEAEGE